jgi:MFS transporter, DHA1 family, multidrug resistance protein
LEKAQGIIGFAPFLVCSFKIVHNMKNDSFTHSSDHTASKEFITLMAMLMSVVAISIDAMLPTLGIIGEALHVTHPNQSQYIISSIFVGMALGQLICGPLSDALGRKRLLYGTLALYLVGSVICLFSKTLEMMLFGRFVQGLGVAGPYISCMSIIRDKFSGRMMARIMSLVMMIFIMVPVVAPAIGQAIVLMLPWYYIFVLYIIYALAAFVWSWLRLEETLPPQYRTPFTRKTIMAGTKTVLTNARTVGYTVCMGCCFGALIGDLNSARQIFQIQYGVGEMFVVYFGLQALAFGASSLMNSRWVERLGMRYICARALMVMVITSAIFLALHMFIPITFPMFFFYGVIELFCIGLLFGNLNALALEPMGHIAGIASAIIGALSNLIAIIFGTLIGQMYDGSLLPLLTGFTVLGIIAWLIMVAIDNWCYTD